MVDITEERAYLYAVWCVEEQERKVGRYVKKQAEAWLRIADGDNPEAYVNEKRVALITRILKLMVHPDLLDNLYDTLEDYAMFLIYAVLCTYKTEDDTRYYNTGILEIGRKNFKTFNVAVIFIISMLTEPRFSRFFSVAPDLKLSGELRQAIKKIIKSSPALVENFKIKVSVIECLLTEAEYVTLTFSKDRLDGKLPRIYIVDEAAAMSSYAVESMRSGQITLDNGLGFVVSTQYPNDQNVFMDEVSIAKKTLDGIENVIDGYFALLYEPDADLADGEAWKSDDRIIYQANPVTVNNKKVFKKLKQKRAAAKLYPRKKTNFLCKHLNIRYRDLGTETFIDIDKVKRCKRVDDVSWWYGRQVYLGLDLSQTEDNTSVAMVTEEDGVLYGKVWAFIPGASVDIKSEKEGVDYHEMIEAGVCFAAGDDEVVDYLFIETFILSLQEIYGVEIMQVGYDRWNALSTVQKLEAEAIDCVEIKQHSSVLHPATKLLKEKILGKSFFYDDNPLLEINFQNARCTEDTNLNKYVNKKRSEGKVDMVVSLINAVFLLMQEQLFGGMDLIAEVW